MRRVRRRLPRVELTPAQHVDVAKAARAAGDDAEAARHIAAALGVDPGHPEALALADALCEEAADPLSLVVPASPPDPAVVALRARFLARLGRAAEAVDYLLHVISIRPATPYTAWLEEWLADDTLRRQLDPDRLAGTVLTALRVLDGSPDGQTYGEAARAALLRCVRTVRHGHEGSTHLLMAHARLASRCAELHEALAVAEALYAADPSRETAVLLAGAHRELGRVDATVSTYREALRFDPENVAVRLGIGDVLLLAGRFSEALSAYEGVLRREPGHEAALPSVYCLKYWLHGRPEWRDALEGLAEEEANERAAALLDEVTPWVGFLPDPTDAIVSSARAVSLQFAGPVDSTTTSRVSVLEAPSAVLAYRLTVGGEHTMHVEQIPAPDPRQPRADVGWRLWTYDGTEPRRAVERPAPGVAAELGRLAARTFHIEDWKGRAHALAQRLGPAATRDLLATMVWPPEAPAEVPAWRWLPRVQLAAALVLAWIDDGWLGSQRRGALLSLANGPTDWTGGAAFIALAEVAREEPALAPEIAELMLETLQAQPSVGTWCLERPLVHSLLRISGLRAYRDRLV